MPIGPLVRRAFGPFEPLVATAYRRMFFDIAALAETIAARSPSRIFEVGCGEGTLAEALLAKLPAANYVGVDICANPGRLFRGDRRRAQFHVGAVEDCVHGHGRTFDLVVACDVIHHVQPGARVRLLRAAATALQDCGTLVLKEWERRANAVHVLAWASDRLITGDRVRYESLTAIRSLLAEALPGLRIDAEHRYGPWRNNVALFLTRSGFGPAKE
jgi:2-polyprenyl-6-hydroxyphenyl methylase/3-demethylubiquinone-9 3-methyltransferase